MPNKSELFETKNKILDELNDGHKGTIDVFVQLLEVLIAEGHQDNENSRGEDFLIIQGGIKKCREIVSFLKKEHSFLKKERS